MFKLIFSVAAVTVLAQLLQLASQPLLTYLYTKESFGYLSVVMSIVAFAALICNFQFNNLILISKENTNKLFRSGLFFSALFELMVFFNFISFFFLYFFRK
jgi:O-antigen/teichoic acid export membrane protein